MCLVLSVWDEDEDHPCTLECSMLWFYTKYRVLGLGLISMVETLNQIRWHYIGIFRYYIIFLISKTSYCFSIKYLSTPKNILSVFQLEIGKFVIMPVVFQWKQNTNLVFLLELMTQQINNLDREINLFSKFWSSQGLRMFSLCWTMAKCVCDMMRQSLGKNF